MVISGTGVDSVSAAKHICPSKYVQSCPSFFFVLLPFPCRRGGCDLDDEAGGHWWLQDARVLIALMIFSFIVRVFGNSFSKHRNKNIFIQMVCIYTSELVVWFIWFLKTNVH